ncbi:MAG: CARDB domain-containing protein [Methanomassiliicoccales archaeon]
MFSLFAGLVIVGVPSVGRAALPSYLPNGDVVIGSGYDTSSWTIDGSVHYMDGNLTIRAGGVVHVIDGGIAFTQDCGMSNDPTSDTNHEYTLTIEDGGQLILENSSLTSYLDQIYNFPSLGVLVQNGGRLEANNGSVLEFPGHLVVDNSTFVLSDSVVQGHSYANISDYCDQNYFPAAYFDSSPVLFFSSSNVLIENSSIDGVFTSNGSAPSLMFNHDYSFASDTAARQDVLYTLERMPSEFGSGNTATGAAIGDIRMSDQRYIDLAPGHLLQTDLNDLYGLVFDHANVRLHVEYHTDAGYAAGNTVFYSFQNAGLDNTGLMIHDTAQGYNTSINGDVQASVALPMMSAEDLTHLTIQLANTDPTATIHINRIWFTIDLSFPAYRSITVAEGTTLTAIDSYLDVDFSNDSLIHDTLQVYDTSQCYLYGTSFNMEKNPDPLASREPAVYTNDVSSTFTPLRKGSADNTNQLIRNITVYGDLRYAVVGGGDVFALDEFNTSSLAGDISSATIYVAYIAPGATRPTNYFQWGLEGQPLRNTSIQPQLTVSLRTGSFDLYAAGVRSVNQLSDLNLRFASVAGQSDVWIDKIWINVTLKPTVYIYRWANVNISDEQGLPVAGATVDAHMMLGGAQAQYYSPSGVSTVPPAEVLSYLGRSAGNYTATGPDGTVRIPLLSEYINSSSMPNSQVVGDYLLNISYQNASGIWYYAEAGVSFYPYPEMGIQSQEVDVTISGLFLDLPDLAVMSLSTNPSTVYINDTVTINAAIRNLGLTGARNVFVEFYDGSNAIGNRTIASIGAGETVILSLQWFATPPGAHTITVKIDPYNKIVELHKGNNIMSIQVQVLPDEPDLAITSSSISINPQPAWTDVPATISVTVSNTLGRADARNVVVAYYSGDPATVGNLLGTSIINVSALGTNVTTFTWIPSQIGTYQIFVVVNPAHNPAEYRYDNNVASTTINVNLTITPYDLVVSGNQVMTFANATFYHRGKVVVEDQGTLIISNATFNILQNHADEFRIYVMDHGTIILNNATLDSNYVIDVYLMNDSVMSLAASSLGGNVILNLDGQSHFTADDSQIGSRIIAPTTSFATIGIEDSSLAQPMNELGGHAFATLTSVVVPSVQPSESALVYHYRMITVTAVDGNKMPIAGAFVELRFYSNDSLYASGLTDEAGVIEFQAICDIITATSNNFVGNYVANASFDGLGSPALPIALHPYTEPLTVQDVSVQLVIASAMPELSITATDINVWPSAPLTGDIVYVNATVHNNGPVAAIGVSVELWAGGFRVSIAVIDVPSEGMNVANLTWVPTLPGTFNLTVLVNPDRTIPESSYANNAASVSITVDVQTGPADLVVQGTSTVVLNGTTFSYAKVVVRDSGTLYITNGMLNINQLVTGAACIFVQDNGKLVIGSAGITSTMQIWMFVIGNGQVVMQTGQLYNNVGLRLEGNAHVTMNGCDIGSDIVAPVGSNAVLDASNTTFHTVWSHFGGNAVARLTACAIPAVALTDNALGVLYQWIDVTVLDGMAAPLPNATVQLRWNVNDTLYAVEMTNQQGVALFRALSDVIYPSSAPEFYGNYLANATFRFNHMRFDSAVMAVSLLPYVQPLLRTDKLAQIQIPGALPDLDPPMHVSNANPYRSDNVTITVNVTNNGVVPANNVLVRFKDGSTLIVDDIIGNIVPGQTVTLTVIWIAVMPLGIHNISVAVDPEGAIKEMTDHSMSNWTFVNVHGIAELSISATDVTVIPNSPTTNTSVSISIVVHNTGDIDALNVMVNFTDITPTGARVRFNTTILSNVPASGTAGTIVLWTPSWPGSHSVLIEVNSNRAVPEHITSNDNVTVPVLVLNYADFQAQNIIFTPTQVAVGAQLSMQASVMNTGQSDAKNVRVYFWLGQAGTGILISDVTILDIGPSVTETATGSWTAIPNTMGKEQFRNITVQVDPFNEIPKIGHANPIYTAQVKVVDMRPDLEFIGGINVTNAGGHAVSSAVYGEAVNVRVVIKNDGYSTAQNALIELSALDSLNFPTMIANTTRTFLANETKVIDFNWTVTLAYPYNYTLKVQIDRPNSIPEISKLNNIITTSFRVNTPNPDIRIGQPISGTEYSLDSQVLVNGYIYNTITQRPLSNITIVTKIVDPTSHQQVGLNITTITTSSGWFQTVLHVPADIPSGQLYNIMVEVRLANQTTQSSTSINVQAQGSETSMPIWVWILIVLVVLAGVVAVSVYMYRTGLGRMVECGECGALIPESAKKCPKCGTVFETGTAKCSQCGAWIPAAATECPECGAKFVTEPMAEEEDEYIKGMRRHYDAYVDNFREQGKAALGKKYNETRFLEWYKKQPSYISFERWLSQEEEKRKTATAFACPVCGTLNPRGSTICNKCGTVFGGQAGAAEPAEAAAVEQKPIRRIVRRPAEKKVVQKKPEEQVPPEQKPPEEASGPIVDEPKPEEPKNP